MSRWEDKRRNRKGKGKEPPTDVHFNGPELLDRFRMQWSEWMTIKGFSTGWSKSGNATCKVILEDEDGEELHRFIPYTGRNKNNHHNSGFLLDVLLACDVPSTITSILLQEGASPLDAIFDAVAGQKILCQMEWAEYQGKWYPTVRRFVEKPGRKPAVPAQEIVDLAEHAKPLGRSRRRKR